MISLSAHKHIVVRRQKDGAESYIWPHRKTHELRRVDLYKIKWLAVDKVTLSCSKEDACYFTKWPVSL